MMMINFSSFLWVLPQATFDFFLGQDRKEVQNKLQLEIYNKISLAHFKGFVIFGNMLHPWQFFDLSNKVEQ